MKILRDLKYQVQLEDNRGLLCIIIIISQCRDDAGSTGLSAFYAHDLRFMLFKSRMSSMRC